MVPSFYILSEDRLHAKLHIDMVLYTCYLIINLNMYIFYLLSCVLFEYFYHTVYVSLE